MNRKMKCFLAVLFSIVLLFAVIFLIGRYGWKLGSFNACESAGISQLSIEDGCVRMQGFYPGSFPQGFLGYHAEQVGDTLYVGFKFSGLFGFFKTGDFDITIPTDGTVKNVVMKTNDRDYPITITDETD